MTKAMCVWYWFIFLPYVCPFLKNLCWTIYWWLCKQNIMRLRRSVRKRKAETVQSDIVGYYPSRGYISMTFITLYQPTSPPKWPSMSLFDDFFIGQTRDRDSKQNIKIPDRSLL